MRLAYVLRSRRQARRQERDWSTARPIQCWVSCSSRTLRSTVSRGDAKLAEHNPFTTEGGDTGDNPPEDWISASPRLCASIGLGIEGLDPDLTPSLQSISRARFAQGAEPPRSADSLTPADWQKNGGRKIPSAGAAGQISRCSDARNLLRPIIGSSDYRFIRSSDYRIIPIDHAQAEDHRFRHIAALQHQFLRLKL